MLVFENVFYSYKKDNFILNDISLKFPECGFVLIKGKSGSGKTTLINLISGLDTPTKGKILFNDEILSADRLTAFRKKEVSIVFQDFNLIRNLSIKENLRIAFEASGFSYNEDEAKKYFEMLSLSFDDVIDRFPNELSGGQQQRIAIIRSLIKKPRIMILDEPTSSLDYSNADDVLFLLKKLSERILVVVASHDLLRLEKMATFIISLDKKDDKKSINESLIDADEMCKEHERAKKRLSFRSIFSFVASLRYKNRFRIIGTLIANSMMLLLVTFSSCLIFHNDNETLLSGQKSMHSPYFLTTLQEKIGTAYQLITPFDEKTESKMMAQGYERLSYVGQIMTSFFDDDVPYIDHKAAFFTSYRRDNFAVELTEDSTFKFDERVEKSKQYYPSQYNEIVITSSIADFLVEYSFQETIDKDGRMIKSKRYNNISDLLEKGYCYDKKITAIFETPDKDYLDFLNKNDSASQMKWHGYTIAKSVFVKKGYNDWLQTQSRMYADFSIYDRPQYMLGKIKNGNDVRATLKEIESFAFKTDKAEYEIKVNNLYNSHIYLSNEFKLDRYPGIILSIFSLVLIFVSGLITASFFSSIAKKEDISLGIMHSLGASKIDICLILLTLQAMLFIVGFLLLLIVYSISWVVVNQIISAEFLFFPYISWPFAVSSLFFMLISILSIAPSLRRTLTVKPLSLVKDYYK